MQNSKMEPNNEWQNQTLLDCVNILDNQRIPVNSDERAKRQGDIPYYGATGQVGWINDYLFNEELILLGEDGAPFLDKSKSIAYIINGKSWVNNHAHVLKAKEGISDNWFVKYYLDYFDFSDYVAGTTRLKLTQSALKTIPIKLPTIEEQKKISSSIKRTIKIIEENKVRIRKAKLLVNKFRQSLLSAAVTGKLTEEWRAENPNIESAKSMIEIISKQFIQKKKKLITGEIYNSLLPEIPQTWAWVRFEQIGELARGKSKHRPRNDPKLFGGKYPFIQTGDVARSKGKILNYNQTYNELGLAQSRLFPKGTLCITIAANIADSGILHIDACFPDSIVGFIPYSPIPTAEYFDYFINTAKDNIEQFAPGTAQKNINLGILNELAIPLPPLEELKEIVKKINYYFDIASKVERQIEKAEFKVSNLTQALLVKTFSNE